MALLPSLLAPPTSLADFVKIKGSVVNVRQGPGTSFPVLFQAEKGEEFNLVRSEGLWYLISLDQGREAWVFGKLVDVVPGMLPENRDVQKSEAGQEEGTTSLAGRVAGILFFVLLLVGGAVSFWKRDALLRFSGRKLREISGYRREQPFRYDNRKPKDDSWEL